MIQSYGPKVNLGDQNGFRLEHAIRLLMLLLQTLFKISSYPTLVNATLPLIHVIH